MLERVRILSAVLRGSLWFVPSVMTGGAILLAFATILLDARVSAETSRSLWFVFGVGPQGVRGVLSAIASSIITVTGVVFSITVVALQLASTQYSPRVLRAFLTDRSTHVVLGTFIATFTFCLVILRTVRGADGDVAAFIPSISVTVAMLLALFSVGCLIFFVHHIAQSIRAAVIVERLTADAVRVASRPFPHGVGRPASSTAALHQPGEEWVVVTERRGYLEAVNQAPLEKLGERGALVLRMETQIGAFRRKGDPLATVRSSPAADRHAIARATVAALPLADEPTGEHDPQLAISRLSDVAIKALSPSINDPATATQCLDGLSDALLTLALAESAPTLREFGSGQVLLETKSPTFAELAAEALGGVRHYGAGDPRICLKLLRVAAAIGARVPGAARDVMQREVELTLRAAERELRDAHELTSVRAEAERSLAALRPFAANRP